MISETGEQVLSVLLSYSQRGWRLVPIRAGEKRPILSAWQNAASAAPEKIREWHGQFSGANWGLVLGPHSGVIDIEADDEEAEATLARLAGEEGLPITPTYQSTRGKHRLFRWSSDLPKANQAVFKVGKLEFRIGGGAKGAQSLLPPSVHPTGTPYRWLVSPDECDPAEISPAMLASISVAVAEGTDDPEAEANRLAAGHPGWSDPEKLAWALPRLGARRVQDYSDWIRTGQAIHAAGGSCGDWIRVSQLAAEKFQPGKCEEHWRSFNAAGGVGLGSLIEWAKTDSSESPPWAGKSKPSLAGAGASRTGGCFRNFDLIETDGRKPIKSPRPMAALRAELKELTGGWPCRVGPALFVPKANGIGVDWLAHHAGLMGWIGTATGEPAAFTNGVGYHKAAELFAELQRGAKEFESVEILPHEPRLPGRYYACEFPAGHGGRLIDQLLTRLRPATDADRTLILAMLMTAVWGGAPGSRPAFAITAPAGRGCGKTTLVKIAAAIHGGAMEFSTQEKIETIKARLLSPEGATQRLAVLDNLKSRSLSWPDGESLITCSTISGKRMYVGESRRPNDLVWLLTMNGVSLSTDWAQRALVIHLGQPEHRAGWEAETFAFIDDNRAGLLGDLLWLLRQPAQPVNESTRWAAWTQAVLARIPGANLAAVSHAVVRRADEANTDADEAVIIAEYFERHRGERVLLTSSEAAEWLRTATNEKQLTTSIACKKLKQLCEEGQIRTIRWKRTSKGNVFEFVEGGAVRTADPPLP